MGQESDLGRIDRAARIKPRSRTARVLLPAGWLLAALGYYGPWIAHRTSALALSGADMGEFVKFLPGVLAGELPVVRQLFYLPPLAVALGIALLVGSQQLGYRWPLQGAMLVVAVPVSLQLLPPAWSPASLMTAEFRLQTLVLGICWLTLGGFRLWARLPSWLGGSVNAALSLAALVLSGWQLWVVKPAIDDVYGTQPTIGWGFAVCMAGLAFMALGSTLVALPWRKRS